jgi:hypothetical protein
MIRIQVKADYMLVPIVLIEILRNGPQCWARSCAVAQSTYKDYAQWPIAQKPISRNGP